MQEVKPLPALQELQAKETDRLIQETNRQIFQEMCMALGRPVIVISWHMGWLVPPVRKGSSHSKKVVVVCASDSNFGQQGLWLECC